mmetsp:Transcript_56340/g.121414  ORF Transcript_56340/g.121414 Transcript_56340/m.121414 type:complete len:167 (+) Transcript_56340:152-652(+)
MGGTSSRNTMNPVSGEAALGAAKVANAIAHKQAAYDQELAKHATYAAMEMDNTRKLVERYILGTDVTTINDVDPAAGQIEGGGPPEYSSFPYPLGSEEWPANYPVPEPPGFPATIGAPGPVREVEASLPLWPGFATVPSMPPARHHGPGLGSKRAASARREGFRFL